MELLIYAVLSFIVIYLMSYFVLVRKADKKKKKKIPVEVQYLINRYNVDLKNMNYKKFLNQICIIGSIDMTIAVIVILPIKNIILQFLIGFVILIPLIIISFKIYAKVLIKKGYVKNGNKRNRK